MVFHETILQQLFIYRETHPSFNFLPRQRTGAGKRFESGHWFQGNDKYAFVGLINASGGITKTRSVGLAFKPKEYGFDCTLQVRFNGEKRSELVSCYKKVISQIGGFDEKDSERFDKNLGRVSHNFSELFDFLDKNYQSINSVFKNGGCEDILVSDQKFNELTKNLNDYRFAEKAIRKEGGNQSASDARVIYAYLKNSLSHRKIQREILGEDAPARGGGFLAMTILHNYDIQKDKKGILNRNSFKDEYHNAKGSYAKALALLKVHYPEFNVDITNNKEMDYPLNTILYGPPGTGKTYQTKDKALNILNVKTSHLSREEIKNNYSKKVEEGQIVFTTFHQSMSYEDFIEGIKPETKDGEKLSYPVKAGIFKTICAKAEDSYLDSIKGISEELPFDEAFEKLKEEWEENEQIKFSMKSEGYDFTILGFTERSIQFRKSSGGTGHTLSISTLRDSYYGTRQITNAGVGIYYPGVVEKLKSYKPINNSHRKNIKNYILIIDEINRGNVSAIFGELITLLEPDKRLGESEQITLELPYSKGESFGVPPNLYIIGTMNTADRSVEALDTALRRRFSFVEMNPNPELLKGLQVDNIKLDEVLQKINERVELLVDKDHTIGHAYFMNLSTAKDLAQAFTNKIIPLLQEYFYGDYGKIGLVLGEGFIEKVENKKVEFAAFIYEGQNDFKTPSFKLKQIDEKSILAAIELLLGKKEIKENQ